MMLKIELIYFVLMSLAVLLWVSVARSEQFNPYVQVTLVAYICNGVTRTHEPVPPKMVVAGKVDDYLEGRGFPMPYNYGLCKAQGFNDASQWLLQSPKYHAWLLHGVQCVPGHYEDPNRT
jgi:hypothetical protein